MFAIVEIAGFQEKVEKGMRLKVPLQMADTGKSITFGNVLMVVDGSAVTIGAPYVAGTSVEVKVLKHGREDKIRIQKANKRKRYRRVAGHRQNFTEVEVTGISAK